jgi:hypothetical protein
MMRETKMSGYQYGLRQPQPQPAEGSDREWEAEQQPRFATSPRMIVRWVGAGLLVLAAVLVWATMAPDQPEPTSTDPRVNAALSDYTANKAVTDSAPQQQVANGWAEVDLLEIIARESGTESPAPPDDRVPALVGLLVLGVALHLATTDARRDS